MDLGFITDPCIRSDEVLAVKATVLLRGIKTKLEVLFEVEVKPGSGEGLEELKMGVAVGARVVYGEGVKEGRMGEFLRGRMGEGWVAAVRELEGRVGRRGGK